MCSSTFDSTMTSKCSSGRSRGASPWTNVRPRMRVKRPRAWATLPASRSMPVTCARRARRRSNGPRRRSRSRRRARARRADAVDEEIVIAHQPVLHVDAVAVLERRQVDLTRDQRRARAARPAPACAGRRAAANMPAFSNLRHASPAASAATATPRTRAAARFIIDRANTRGAAPPTPSRLRCDTARSRARDARSRGHASTAIDRVGQSPRRRRDVAVEARLGRHADARVADQLGHTARRREHHRQAGRHRFDHHGRTRIVVLGVDRMSARWINRGRVGLRVAGRRNSTRSADPELAREAVALRASLRARLLRHPRRPVTSSVHRSAATTSSASVRTATSKRYQLSCDPASSSVSGRSGRAPPGVKTLVSTALWRISQGRRGGPANRSALCLQNAL